MAIVARSLVEAIDFNQLAGTTASNRPFPSAEAAQNRLNAIYGVGWGDRGYGQLSPSIPAINRGSLVAGSDWQNLLANLEKCNSYLGLSMSGAPSPASYNSGGSIAAISFDWATAVAAVDSARLSPLSANLINKNLLTDTRTSPWSEKPQLLAELDFGTEDAARWFFNSGGQIVISSSFVPSSATAHNQSWQQLLSDAGTISMGAYGSERTGGTTAGTLYSNIGYYSLNDSAQQVFSIQPASGPFSVNIYSILIQRLNYQGANGSNGSRVSVSVFFDDQYGTPAQAVTGSLSVNINIVRAGAVLTIADPAVTVQEYLEGGGGGVFFEFNDTVTTQITNYDLLARATLAAQAVDPLLDLATTPLRATVIVATSGVIGSTSTASAAFSVAALPATSTVRIINNGYIVGKGGDGGAGWSWAPPPNPDGLNGGPAIALASPTTVVNYGTIGGGGGGGGGSSTGSNPETYDDPGGCGGGGAGFTVGMGGTVGPGLSYYGQNGTLTAGGAGGTVSPTGGYSEDYSGADGGFVIIYNGSAEWFFGKPGGAGGNLGQAGQAGSGDYGAGTAGAAGISIIGSSQLSGDSVLGNILGPLA